MRPSEATLAYRKTYACVLEKPQKLKRPVPISASVRGNHWVRLDGRVEREILDQLA
jgi:hypothetical protein